MSQHTFETIMFSGGYVPAQRQDNGIVGNENINAVPSQEHSLHSHPFYILLYIESCDDFPTHIDTGVTRFQPDHFYLLPPYTLHAPNNQYSGAVTMANLKFYCNDVAFRERLGTTPLMAAGTPELRKYMHEIIISSDTLTGEARLAALSAHLEGFFPLFLSHCRPLDYVVKDDIYDKRLLNVVKYMYANCGRNITLGELADVAYMNRTSFSRKFKRLYGISPIDYLFSVRLFRSMDLMLSPELSISDIAKAVGFLHVSNYSNAFARMFGIFPSIYRDQLKGHRFSSCKLALTCDAKEKSKSK